MNFNSLNDEYIDRCGTTNRESVCSLCWVTSTTSAQLSSTRSTLGSSAAPMIRLYEYGTGRADLVSGIIEQDVHLVQE